MSTKPKSWRDLLPIHRAAELFPMMSEEELRALGEDIKKNGLREGIALLDGELLDGRNRLEAMETVGIKLTTGNGQIEWTKIPFRNVKGADPIAFVISKNIRRRHLTADQKREIIAKLLKATPEKSDRQIAEETDSNRTTVGQIRAKMEKAGDVSIVDTRTDTRGRKQRARKSPTTMTKPAKKSAGVAVADRAEARARKPEPAPENEQDHIDLTLEWDRQVRISTSELMHKLKRKHWSRVIQQLRELVFEVERWADDPSELPLLHRSAS
jgi:hypothetical protein